MEDPGSGCRHANGTVCTGACSSSMICRSSGRPRGHSCRPPVHHEFAVDSVQDGLQVVPLSRVLAVKQLQYPHHKRLHRSGRSFMPGFWGVTDKLPCCFCSVSAQRRCQACNVTESSFVRLLFECPPGRCTFLPPLHRCPGTRRTAAGTRTRSVAWQRSQTSASSTQLLLGTQRALRSTLA